MGSETRCSSGSNGALPTQWDTIPWAFTGRPAGLGFLVKCLRRVLSFLFKLIDRDSLAAARRHHRTGIVSSGASAGGAA
jgi:hypothetical protein